MTLKFPTNKKRKALTKPSGPTFGAKADVAPTSPPTQRR